LVLWHFAYFVVEGGSKSVLVAARGYHLKVMFNQYFGLLLVSDFFIRHKCKTTLICWLKLRVLGLLRPANLLALAKTTNSGRITWLSLAPLWLLTRCNLSASRQYP
jgi:GT2 family glycosyltransferase